MHRRMMIRESNLKEKEPHGPEEAEEFRKLMTNICFK
jgi:hypothetical protein